MFDFVFEKRSSGVWVEWMETLDSTAANIPPNATVSLLLRLLSILLSHAAHYSKLGRNQKFISGTCFLPSLPSLSSVHFLFFPLSLSFTHLQVNPQIQQNAFVAAARPLWCTRCQQCTFAAVAGAAAAGTSSHASGQDTIGH